MYFVYEWLRHIFFGLTPQERLAAALGTFNMLADELDNVRLAAKDEAEKVEQEIDQLVAKRGDLNKAYGQAARARDNVLKMIGEEVNA